MWHLVTAQQWKETFCLTENEARILRRIQREYNRGLCNVIVMMCFCKCACFFYYLFPAFFLSFCCSWLSSLTLVCSPGTSDCICITQIPLLASLSPQPGRQTYRERRKEQNEGNFSRHSAEALSFWANETRLWAERAGCSGLYTPIFLCLLL